MTPTVHPGVGFEIAGEFTIVRPLGEGGMGAVYVAVQRSTGKERALKIMHREIVADPALKKRFEQEARVGAHIRSEHVVDVVAAGVDAATGLPYLVMELLEGEDLGHRLERGPLELGEIRTVFEELCHAMAAAHAGGVVHRDLKPENVFLARLRRAGSSSFTVKVLDFGIAKLAMESGTRATRGAVGSPMWMAPEQTAPAPVTAAADVWALGLLAFHLFTGKSFWRAANDATGTTPQLLRELVLDPIPAASARAAERGDEARLPAGFDAWFARCVAREPAARFPDAGAAWGAMRPLFGVEADTLRDDPPIALAETFVASEPNMTPGRPVVRTPLSGETGDATAFQPSEAAVKAVSAPPMRAASSAAPSRPESSGDALRERSAAAPETPIASVRDEPAAKAAPRASRLVPLAVGALVAVGVGVGVVAGVYFARADAPTRGAPPPSVSLSDPPVASSLPVASVAPTTSAAPDPPAASASAAATTIAATSPAATTSRPPSPSAASAASSAAPPRRAPLASGFGDPSDRNGAVTWKVQDRHVRLFTRLVSNDSNVADAVVKKAVEWSSWEYLRCYERAFGGAKELPEGVVTVGFDILDQLPRHGKLVSSTIKSDSFNDCVVRTLIGQTINAAGPDGKGHAVHAFRFVPN